MFRYVDVSTRTKLSVTASRWLPRRGFCIHTTMGMDSLGWLQGGSAASGSPASADYLVKPEGTIYQITRAGWYAYHTGVARYLDYQEGDQSLNQSLVGIECECAEQRGYRITNDQYIALAALCNQLCVVHKLVNPWYVTHRMIALPPGRKTDPNHFDNNVFIRERHDPSPEAALYEWGGRMS